jgi:hypothetical protein
MVALALSLAVLVCFGACGVAILRRLEPSLDVVEQLAYGVPLGAVAASWAILALACVFGLNAALVLAVAAGGLLVSTISRPWPRWTRGRLGAGAVFAMLVLAAFGLRWILFWSGALTLDDHGLWASQRSLWADSAQHLGDICSFAYGDNFPPAHPRFPGHAFNYHYLTSLTTAALVKLGLAPWTALSLHSFVFSSFIALGVFVFARRLGLGHAPSAVVVLLLLLGGGIAWWTTLVSHQAATYRWLNVYFAMIAPQRGFLYGLPLGLLTLRVLFLGLERDRLAGFVSAGLFAGLLPYAHLGTFLALALLTPFLILAFPTRKWLGFVATWVIVAGPQLLVQQGGSAGAAGALRWAPGWVAPPDPWLWFWLKNLGLFLPLLLASFAVEGLVSPRARRFLLAFQPLFVLANLFVFQPWDWDNTKVLIWWYLAASIFVAALLSRLWDIRPVAVTRPLAALIVVSLILSGVLENWDQAAKGHKRDRLLTVEEIDLARRIRETTDPHALFAVGLQSNHPIPMLSGRRVLMSYTGWLWSQGIDTTERRKDVASILTLSPVSRALIETFRVDYVVVGPDERNRFGADPEAWRALYPDVARSENYDVFAVRNPPR